MTFKVQGLSVTRGGLGVLAGVSFEVAPGTALILRGPNGSGKTSLLRTLAGLQPSGGGTVSHGPDAVAYGAHADGLKTTLTVAENLAFWASVFGTGTVYPAAERFGLSKLMARPAGRLSAGQKRRVGLARLMLTGRPVWLLDEPTVSLDAEGVTALGDAVSAHLEDGGMAVLATHIDLGLSAPTFDVAPYKAAPLDSPFDGVFG